MPAAAPISIASLPVRVGRHQRTQESVHHVRRTNTSSPPCQISLTCVLVTYKLLVAVRVNTNFLVDITTAWTLYSTHILRWLLVLMYNFIASFFFDDVYHGHHHHIDSASQTWVRKTTSSAVVFKDTPSIRCRLALPSDADLCHSTQKQHSSKFTMCKVCTHFFMLTNRNDCHYCIPAECLNRRDNW